MNSKFMVKLLSITVMLMLLAACGGGNAEPENPIPNPVPATSKFSKVEIGWSMKRVHDVIGDPTDTRSYTTGKAWIPFYFGSDHARIEDLYKGEGRIIYSGGTGLGSQGWSVLKIIYDATEKGYNDNK